MKIIGICAAVAMWVGAPVWAHEFWISPTEYRVAEGAPLMANIRVGEDFKGGAYAYAPPNVRRFEIVMGDQVMPVTGRAGDRPALNMAVPDQGLAIVVHVTRDYTLTYKEAEKWANFVNHKDFRGALERHVARGLPEVGFKERYSRYGKSLMAVGDGAGMDREVGLETEIVALANPYTDDLGAGFPVQVFYQGAPRANEQVELFEKSAESEVTITQHRTDDQGRVTLPVKAGHQYLVDSVVLRELQPEGDSTAVWESLWASLTFEVPD